MARVKARGRLRIVAGKWRSRLLPIIDEPGLRPTSARIRETLFNWLNPVIEGARCLDLFAGTGALGIEALSRGAAHVVFVEKSVRAADALQNCLATLEATNAEVCLGDALEYLRRTDRQRFDIVFLDPPFDTDVLSDLCKLLDENGWLATNAVIYFEQSKDRATPALPTGWAVSHEKVAGQVSYALVSTAAQT